MRLWLNQTPEGIVVFCRDSFIPFGLLLTFFFNNSIKANINKAYWLILAVSFIRVISTDNKSCEKNRKNNPTGVIEAANFNHAGRAILAVVFIRSEGIEAGMDYLLDVHIIMF